MSPWLVLFLTLGAPYRSVVDGAAPRTPQTYTGALTGAPSPHWRVPLPGGRLNAGAHTELTEPVIVGDSIYVGSAAGKGLYRMSRSDGSVTASYLGDSSMESEALVVGEVVVFGDTGGHVRCFSLDGTERWSYQTGAPVLVRPTMHEGRVYITNVDDLVVALELETGALVWRYQQKPDVTRAAELSLYDAPPAVVQGDEVLVGFSTGDLVGLTVDGGDARWTVRVGEGRYPDLVATPRILGDLIFVSGYLKPLLALDRSTRKVVWALEHGSSGAPLVLERPDPVLVHPGTDGVLRAVDARTGSPVWVWESGDSAALTAPVHTDAGVLVASSAGSVSLVDEDTGKLVWTFDPLRRMEGVTRAPVSDGRQVLFVSNAGLLYSMLGPSELETWDAAWPTGKDAPLRY